MPRRPCHKQQEGKDCCPDPVRHRQCERHGVSLQPHDCSNSGHSNSIGIGACADSYATPAPTPAPTTNDGAALYAANCSSCHGPLATSGKAGATAVSDTERYFQKLRRHGTIFKPHDNADPGHCFCLSDARRQLRHLTPTPTPTPTDGATLYAANCSSCHGASGEQQQAGSNSFPDPDGHQQRRRHELTVESFDNADRCHRFSLSDTGPVDTYADTDTHANSNRRGDALHDVLQFMPRRIGEQQQGWVQRLPRSRPASAASAP